VLNEAESEGSVMASSSRGKLSRLFRRWLAAPILGLAIGSAIGSASVFAIGSMSTFNLADANHDRRVTRAEFDGLTERIPALLGCFDDLDKNNDGYITPDEWSLTPDGRDPSCSR
jgi:hypothetical protein